MSTENLYQARHPMRLWLAWDAASLGLDKVFNGLSDVFYEKDGGLLLADSGNHRILALDANLRLVREYTGVEKDGALSPFQPAQGSNIC